jgi:hypothetical protein
MNEQKKQKTRLNPRLLIEVKRRIKQGESIDEISNNIKTEIDSIIIKLKDRK